MIFQSTFDVHVECLPLTCLLAPRPVSSSAVRRRREEPGRSRSDDAVLRPAGRQPGVCGHLAPARLSQRWGQHDVRGHAQHESPQPEHQQQQRSVRAEPQHQHHVGDGGTLGTLRLPPPPPPVLHTVTRRWHQGRDDQGDGFIEGI